jgi:hypothetical protein
MVSFTKDVVIRRERGEKFVILIQSLKGRKNFKEKKAKLGKYSIKNFWTSFVNYNWVLVNNDVMQKLTDGGGDES